MGCDWDVLDTVGEWDRKQPNVNIHVQIVDHYNQLFTSMESYSVGNKKAVDQALGALVAGVHARAKVRLDPTKYSRLCLNRLLRAVYTLMWLV